jgi:hypothetical protein
MELTRTVLVRDVVGPNRGEIIDEGLNEPVDVGLVLLLMG